MKMRMTVITASTQVVNPLTHPAIYTYTTGFYDECTTSEKSTANTHDKLYGTSLYRIEGPQTIHTIPTCQDAVGPAACSPSNP